jgi:hypothetical protein
VFLNRFAFSAETVCEGLGTVLDEGVWEHVVGLGVGLHQLSEQWTGFTIPWVERTLGHQSWSFPRKTDPEWTVGLPNDGAKCIIDIQDAITQGATMARWIYPRQSEPPATTDATFILEAFQILAVKADTQVEYGGATGTRAFLEENGLDLGVWDQAFVDLVAKLCPWSDGTGIGPREEVRLLALQPGIRGADGTDGKDGKVEVGNVLDLSTTAIVTAVS